MDGCYAEYFRPVAAFATPLPAGVSVFDAAPLTCAGVTTYKAVGLATGAVVAVADALVALAVLPGRPRSRGADGKSQRRKTQ